MQSIFHGSWLQVDLNDQELRSPTSGKGWKPLQYVCRDNTSAIIHKCGKGETLGDKWRKKGGSEKRESTEDAKKGERGKLRARDLWVIYALADSIVLFSFMQTPNG